MSESRGFSVGARARSFYFAARGIKTMFISQHNAWIHAVATVLVIALGLVAGLTRLEWFVLVLAIVAVWMAESINTAFEFLCDVTSPEFHPLVEKAKDVAAGAVLITSIGATAIGALVFVPYVCGLLGIGW
jgi:diacylglycerol kinase (ATP)